MADVSAHTLYRALARLKETRLLSKRILIEELELNPKTAQRIRQYLEDAGLIEKQSGWEYGLSARHGGHVAKLSDENLKLLACAVWMGQEEGGSTDQVEKMLKRIFGTGNPQVQIAAHTRQPALPGNLAQAIKEHRQCTLYIKQPGDTHTTPLTIRPIATKEHKGAWHLLVENPHSWEAYKDSRSKEWVFRFIRLKDIDSVELRDETFEVYEAAVQRALSRHDLLDEGFTPEEPRTLEFWVSKELLPFFHENPGYFPGQRLKEGFDDVIEVTVNDWRELVADVKSLMPHLAPIGYEGTYLIQDIRDDLAALERRSAGRFVLPWGTELFLTQHRTKRRALKGPLLEMARQKAGALQSWLGELPPVFLYDSEEIAPSSSRFSRLEDADRFLLNGFIKRLSPNDPCNALVEAQAPIIMVDPMRLLNAATFIEGRFAGCDLGIETERLERKRIIFELLLTKEVLTQAILLRLKNGQTQSIADEWTHLLEAQAARLCRALLTPQERKIIGALATDRPMRIAQGRYWEFEARETLLQHLCNTHAAIEEALDVGTLKSETAEAQAWLELYNSGFTPDAVKPFETRYKNELATALDRHIKFFSKPDQEHYDWQWLIHGVSEAWFSDNLEWEAGLAVMAVCFEQRRQMREAGEPLPEIKTKSQKIVDRDSIEQVYKAFERFTKNTRWHGGYWDTLDKEHEQRKQITREE